MNLTEGVHPICLHRVRFQILDRRRFDGFQFMSVGTLRFMSAATPPEPNELGCKDTVRVNATTVSRNIVAFLG